MWKTWPLGPVAFMAALAVCVASRPASAHPHIWIDVVATLMFDNAKLTAVRFQWTFDEFFSSGVISEFDKNNDKAFDGPEVEALRKGAFEGVKEVGYFTDILIDGQKVDIDETKDFAAAIEKGAAVYQFTVPLANALDPSKTSFAISVFDKSYFVDIAFTGGKDGVKLSGPSGGCSVEVIDDRDNPLFGGVVFPKKAQLACASK